MEQINEHALPIEERNEWFNSLTRRQRAVEVAKDVLKQLDLKNYFANAGQYFDTINIDLDSFEESRSLQDVLEKNNSCYVCAIGATFASCVRLGNEVKMKQLNAIKEGGPIEGDFYSKKTNRAFTYREMRGMETVFEQRDVMEIFTAEERVHLLDYAKKVLENNSYVSGLHSMREDEFMLRNLMQNVIENEGRFIVSGVRMSANNDRKW